MSHDTTNPPLKRCSKCGESKPLTSFCRDVRRKDGHCPTCRDCQHLYYEKYAETAKANARRRYAENPEKGKAASRKQREADPEKCREYCRRWYAANRERARENSRRWHSEHPENVRETRIRWYKAHPEKAKVETHKRRARRRNAKGTHTAEDVRRQYNTQKGRCWWCGHKLKGVYHVDHLIPLARGGSNAPENIVVTCPHCNLSKGAKLPQEWCGRLF